MYVKTGCSIKPDVVDAVEEIAGQIKQDSLKFILFFTSTIYDPDRLISLLSDRFPGVQIAGCTSAGEITSDGFQHNGITAAGFAGDKIEVVGEVIENLQNFQSLFAKTAVEKCCQKLGVNTDELDQNDFFGMTLIDGLSHKEESIISTLSLAAPSINIVGGSAGDDFKLEKTFVFLNGCCYNDAALFLLFKSRIPFSIISKHHFLPTKKEFVVTNAKPEKRIIYKINNKPAWSEYARMVGMKPKDITIENSDQYPFGFEVEGRFFIRSILKEYEPLSEDLWMASAVNEGTVLTLMESGDMVADTEGLIKQLQVNLGEKINLLILFNCLGRYMEAEAKGISKRIYDSLNISPIVGLNTYGEQIGSLHINHSLTGVAFGSVKV